MKNDGYETFTHSQHAYLISKTLKRTIDTFIIILFLIIGYAIISLRLDGITFAAFETIILLPFIILLYIKLRSVNRDFGIWTREYMNDSYVLIFNTTIPKGNNTEEKIFNLAKNVFPELYEQYSKFYNVNKFGHEAIVMFFKKIFRKKTVSVVTENINSKLGKDYYINLGIKTLEGYFIVKDFNEDILTIERLKDFVKVLDMKINRKKLKSLEKIKLIDPKIFRVICVAKNYDNQFLERESLERIMTRDLKINFPVDLIIEEEVGYTVLFTS